MKQRNLMSLIMIPLFAALCYLSLVIFFFPVGGMFIHIGNLLVVTAALLIGGWQGGLAGAIGMGLFDILNGHVDSAPKTLILKFLIGLTVGLVYVFLTRRKTFPLKSVISLSGVFFIGSLVVLIYYFGRYQQMYIKGLILTIAFAVIGILFGLFAFFGKKLSPTAGSAAVAATCGMAVNLIGEFLYRTVFLMLSGTPASSALSAAAIYQSSTLINGILAVIGGVMLFMALQKPYEAIIKDGK